MNDKTRKSIDVNWKVADGMLDRNYFKKKRTHILFVFFGRNNENRIHFSGTLLFLLYFKSKEWRLIILSVMAIFILVISSGYFPNNINNFFFKLMENQDFTLIFWKIITWMRFFNRKQGGLCAKWGEFVPPFFRGADIDIQVNKPNRVHVETFQKRTNVCMFDT